MIHNHNLFLLQNRVFRLSFLPTSFLRKTFLCNSGFWGRGRARDSKWLQWARSQALHHRDAIAVGSTITRFAVTPVPSLITSRALQTLLSNSPESYQTADFITTDELRDDPIHMIILGLVAYESSTSLILLMCGYFPIPRKVWELTVPFEELPKLGSK